jgi:hypothetical protein
VALRFDADRWDDVRMLLEDAHVEISRIVRQTPKARAASARP